VTALAGNSNNPIASFSGITICVCVIATRLRRGIGNRGLPPWSCDRGSGTDTAFKIGPTPAPKIGFRFSGGEITSG
jgi:hypothetical protein